ncbi:PLP-dependent aminotransferase family protein [Mucilaginibacter sp. R-33]|uniref:aminotransferase-like domain-containing protein n=1 Tax=Mucilaginibacter sp. R-33 TaxID=3416711 RepID=UPI003CE71E0C
MLPFETLISINRSDNLAVFRQIANQLIEHIRNGVINKGDLLPGTRAMASLLKVHRKTVIAAFNEMEAQGWIYPIARKGFAVALELPEFRPRKWDKKTAGYGYETTVQIPLTNQASTALIKPEVFQLIIDDGHPDHRLAPLHLLNREYNSRMRNSYAFRHIPATLPPGSIKLRTALVNHLGATRGIQLQEQHVIITHGAQMSIYIAASLLLSPGKYVVVGEPGFYVANDVFNHMGAHIIRVPVDENGIDVAVVAEVCKKHPISMLYLIPHHHHPTTVTLSPLRRIRLLELAEQFNFIIVEDDYDYDFHYSSSPYLPLAAGNHHNRVVYIGSFSKSLTTSIRIGFMIGPTDFIRKAVRLRRLIDMKGDHILEDALATLLINGDISKHLKKANKIYLERRDHLCAELEAHLKGVAAFQKPSGGLAIWVKFDKNYLLSNIAARAAKRGLYVNDGNLFDTPEIKYNAIRFGFASMNLNELSETINILAMSL